MSKWHAAVLKLCHLSCTCANSHSLVYDSSASQLVARQPFCRKVRQRVAGGEVFFILVTEISRCFYIRMFKVRGQVSGECKQSSCAAAWHKRHVFQKEIPSSGFYVSKHLHNNREIETQVDILEDKFFLTILIWNPAFLHACCRSAREVVRRPHCGTIVNTLSSMS